MKNNIYVRFPILSITSELFNKIFSHEIIITFLSLYCAIVLRSRFLIIFYFENLHSGEALKTGNVITT